MSEIALQKNNVVVVTRTGSSEVLVHIKLVDADQRKATLDFANGARVSVYTLEEWDQLQADRKSGKRQPGTQGPTHQAPYLN